MNGQTRSELNHRGPLTDHDRACEILAREGLEGVVVTDPRSVYHLTGYNSVGFDSFLPSNPTCCALMSKDRSKPVALIISSRQYHWDLSHWHDSPDLIVYQYTDGPQPHDLAAKDTVLATGFAELKAGDVFLYPDLRREPKDDLETRREQRVLEQAKARPVSTSRKLALQKALKDLGMVGGRIGVDFPTETAEFRALEDIVPRASLVSADRALALMRLVKSAVEIALLRRAAHNTAEAARAACKTVRAGGSYRDLRAAFFTEAARRGNLGYWIIVDRVIHDWYDPGFRNGQAFMIDAVSTYQGYHGDYGRTIFVGEPSRHMRDRTRAIEITWTAIRERLRPGLSFREIQAIGTEALRKSGSDTAVRITPHSVGIVHTDARALGDIVLEPGMVLSVDCPVIEAGVGGSAHLEDMTLITADGHEMLNDTAEPVIMV